MRSILNISLPPEMITMIKEEMEKRHFPTVSEFFRDLLRRHYEEQEVLAVLRESEKEVAEGKGKVLKSLKDLR
ncbi:hypothetical protein COY07_01745 [Candidatus Peregrinibacteria bacterium CG_4_10_14_0_2_um_filter_43_11]|nr:MAG: hypothetical protein COY07_01745 [Candidatus Peregrinibacteria bacterium CG_4_10_14_0_2_um_filter_43_11]